MNIRGRISIKVYGSVAAVVGFVVFQLISKAFQTDAGTNGSILRAVDILQPFYDSNFLH